MIIFADNCRLSTSLVTNRNNFYNSSKSKTNNEKTSQSENSNQVIEITKSNNISSIDFDVVDENTWYEIEGVLEKVTDAANNTALAIRVTNWKK